MATMENVPPHTAATVVDALSTAKPQTSNVMQVAERYRSAQTAMCRPLREADPVMFALMRCEEHRQRNSLNLVASENFASTAVLHALGSCLTNKYSEGQPGKRYYGGNEYIDEIEKLCKDRALKAFDLDSSKWAVNVQPLSGSPANFAVYAAFLNPHDRIMGLDLPSGGHLSHGYYSAKKKISATSVFYESLPYVVNVATGLIDFDDLRQKALVFKPKLIIAGISAYSRDLQLDEFRKIADEVQALLLCDMAHISGLVAAGLVRTSPFDYADIVSSTTHKVLRGPRSGIVFVRKDLKMPFSTTSTESAEDMLDSAVFPGLQGGPHNNNIAALAVQLHEVASPEWKQYAKQVVANAKALAAALQSRGLKIVTDGTDNHMMMIDLRPLKLSGNKFQLVCDKADISVNKNAIHGDKSPMIASGVRLGTPAVTTRGLTEGDMTKIADFIMDVVNICTEAQQKYGTKFVDFEKGVASHEKISKLRNDVNTWCMTLAVPSRPME